MVEEQQEHYKLGDLPEVRLKVIKYISCLTLT